MSIDKRFVIPTLPTPGGPKWERMVERMRQDLYSNMRLTKIEVAARSIVEADGRDFDEEFTLWKASGKSAPLMTTLGARLYKADVEVLDAGINQAVRKNPAADTKVKKLYRIYKSL